MNINDTNIKTLLDQRAEKYNHIDFIETDPIQIPHSFTQKEDVEIAGLLAATIAWGQRKSIINNAKYMMELMDQSPYDFVMNADNKELATVGKFVHRTFNGEDFIFFLISLRNIYRQHKGLENVFAEGYQMSNSVFGALRYFRNTFLEIEHNKHVTKHISDVAANSSAKRLNMFLRWMVRSDDKGVDFGLWKSIPTSALMLPLDVHTGDVGRALGLLGRKQNDWKAVDEITCVLRTFDSEDPIKYDFALFGMGAFEKNKHDLPII